MLKTVRVPVELLAIEQMQRARTGVPLYLPAFQPQILEAEAHQESDESDLDWGVEAGGLTIGPEDDDFY